jgi:hypothetical protein
MEKLEESQRLAEQRRRERVEEEEQNAESVARPLRKAQESTPALVQHSDERPVRKQLLS